MDELTSVGVGTQIGTIAALPVDYRHSAVEFEQKKLPKHVPGRGFAATVRSRKVLKVVLERVYNSADLTFDYFSLLTVASLIAVGMICLYCLL